MVGILDIIEALLLVLRFCGIYRTYLKYVLRFMIIKICVLSNITNIVDVT